MTPRSTIALALGVVALSACTPMRQHQGFILDEELVGALQPGVDNRASVERTLGRPTFAADFDGDTWYYVSRNTRQIAFIRPKPVAQLVVRVKFDAAGNVASVDKAGLDRVVALNPNGDKTVVPGKTRSLLDEIFGNIGQVGSTSTQSRTADNPDG